jgi:hypothetical protein
MSQLPDDLTPPGAPAAANDLVRAVVDQAALDLPAREPSRPGAQLAKQRLLGAERVWRIGDRDRELSRHRCPSILEHGHAVNLAPAAA